MPGLPPLPVIRALPKSCSAETYHDSAPRWTGTPRPLDGKYFDDVPLQCIDEMNKHNTAQHNLHGVLYSFARDVVNNNYRDSGSRILYLLWPPCVADADIIFLPCGFFFFYLFFLT